MLRLKKISKYYSDFKALNDISFTVETGEITGFLGPNGAGKTTTMRILTGYLSADSGEIQFDRKSLDENYDKLIYKIGYLPENNPLYTNMRVDELLIFTANLKNETNLEELYDIAEKCGIETVLEKEISTLSKGYKQRVGLAKALIANPDYLILDEPTEGLDPNQKREILKLIKSFSKEKTILFSSHILSEVSQIADKIIVINEGNIVAEGDKNTLMKEHLKEAVISIRSDAPQAELRKKLNQIDTIARIKRGTKGFGKFSDNEILCTSPEDTAFLIFDTAVKNNWRLGKLEIKSQELEDLFKELTK